MKHQFHYGKKFYLDKKSGYWISTTAIKIRAHVWVWQYHNGKPEKGLQIHHIDHNKSNNDISNLELLTVKEHVKKHECPIRKEKNKLHIDNIRSLTKEWHSSPEGIEWHRLHGLKTWKERKSFKINCLQCGSLIETKTYHQKFCHQNCKAKYARRILKSQVDRRM